MTAIEIGMSRYGEQLEERGGGTKGEGEVVEEWGGGGRKGRRLQVVEKEMNSQSAFPLEARGKERHC